jgi:two-component system sensor histidine kinase KdpD
LLDEAATQSAMLRESERLYTTLLNSISHELRTPIAGMAGAADSLLDPAVAADEAARRVLVMNIQEGADRLNRLVENLLDMSRLDSGRLQLRREWCDPGDLIATAVRRSAAGLVGHPLTVAVAPGLPLVDADFVLIEQLLVNLLDNAGKYTPAATPIHLSAQVEEKQLVIRVTDAGPGIPVAEQERIFDKFYRLPGSASGGTGLGLSVCRGLAQAHGGTLVAHNVSTGGAQFVLRLPLSSRQPVAREIE